MTLDFCKFKRTAPSQLRTIKAKKLDLVAIDMSADLVDPPAAYFLGSENVDWQMNVQLTLEFDKY